MPKFANKVVVITGGTSGIGLAAAKQFIKEGAKVIVTGRSPQSVGEAQKVLGATGVAIAADVTEPPSSMRWSGLQQIPAKRFGKPEEVATASSPPTMPPTSQASSSL